MEFVRFVIHPSTAKIYDCQIADGWNPHLTRLSSHTKRVRYGVGIPVWLAKIAQRAKKVKVHFKPLLVIDFSY
jgi:hypothetical protein